MYGADDAGGEEEGSLVEAVVGVRERPLSVEAVPERAEGLADAEEEDSEDDGVDDDEGDDGPGGVEV